MKGKWEYYNLWECRKQKEVQVETAGQVILKFTKESNSTTVHGLLAQFWSCINKNTAKNKKKENNQAKNP